MIKVYLYQDYVHNNSILHQRLQAFFGADAVTYCDADAIIDGALDQTVNLLVMPGGADLFYCEKLNGAGNQQINDYVHNGGAYLGICAGAYYACARLDWLPKVERAKINGPRELAFHAGSASGPIRDYICQQDYDHIWDGVARLSWQGEEIKSLYRAGPLFEAEQGEATIAHYADLKGTPPAIMQCTVGKGQAVLCSPHIECQSEDYRKILYRHRNPDFDYCNALIEELAPDDMRRDALWRDVLGSLL
jgi:glutamine amidotransferase-like uncharacterized protein